jgi:putative glutamine amidotransferase
MKPRIGITFANQELSTDQEYIEAVLNTGGEPVVLRPDSPSPLESLQGLVLSGGEDVDPEFYHEKKEPFCEEIDRKRDEFEFSVLSHFLDKKKPILAICRGIQVLNVATGGTLYQDLQHQLKGPLLPPHLDRKMLTREQKRAMRHEVLIHKGTKIHQLFGDTTESNSRHHQAIKDVAPGLKVTAKSTDGVIEAVESTVHPWVVGVEWHPESREVYSQFETLFKEFISTCDSTQRTRR